ncbi:MAG: gas vesicle protein [Acidobacteriia bacterium]|nr:gas vesicle protein [Terriglobia bacterium]
MRELVANTDDLISVLDRVLDKGIVLESWARLSLQESGFSNADSRVPAGSKISVESSAVYVGYGTRGSWREDVELDDLFPFWRRDLWSK